MCLERGFWMSEVAATYISICFTTYGVLLAERRELDGTIMRGITSCHVGMLLRAHQVTMYPFTAYRTYRTSYEIGCGTFRIERSAI